MWCLGTWFSGGLGSAGLTVGLDDLKGLFQPKRFYDSNTGYCTSLVHNTACTAAVPCRQGHPHRPLCSQMRQGSCRKGALVFWRWVQLGKSMPALPPDQGCKAVLCSSSRWGGVYMWSLGAFWRHDFHWLIHSNRLL